MDLYFLTSSVWTDMEISHTERNKIRTINILLMMMIVLGILSIGLGLSQLYEQEGGCVIDGLAHLKT